jgi:hypothetical protein
VLAVPLAAACKSQDVPAPSPSVSPSVAAAPTTSAAFDAGSHPGGATAASVVRAWNKAINSHDADALGALYADLVELYGQVIGRDKAVALKRVAFGGHLRDDIENVVVAESGRATFHKKSTQKSGKVIDVQGYLDIKDGKITSEGDTTTDKNLLRARGLSCESALMDLVMSTPEAKKRAKEIDDAKVGRGMMAMPPEKPGGTWDVAVCENYEDRMPCYDHFDVDPATAKVLYSSFGGDAKPLTTEPALATKVRTACAP